MTNNKRKKKNIRKVAVRVLFIGIILYSGYTLISQQITLVKSQKTKQECEDMISQAKGEQARLQEELGLVETDEYKEQKARELLGYVKPDERIYIDVTK